MRHDEARRPVFFICAAVAVLAAVVFGCPLSMMTHAQMTDMMDGDMPGQGTAVMCPMSYGVPAHPTNYESGGFVLEPLPVHLDPNPVSATRTIFHPPTLS